MSQALRGLDDWERSTLTAITSKVLRGLKHSQVERDRRCRLCDDTACPDDTCPMMAT